MLLMKIWYKLQLDPKFSTGKWRSSYGWWYASSGALSICCKWESSYQGRPLHFILVLMHFFQQIKFGSSLLWNTFPIAGKPANSRKVCWKRSNRDISVSQWLVSITLWYIRAENKTIRDRWSELLSSILKLIHSHIFFNKRYLLKIVESGDNVRLQYRSLKKMVNDDRGGGLQAQPVESNSL